MLDAEAFPLVSFLTFHKHFPDIDYLGPGVQFYTDSASLRAQAQCKATEPYSEFLA
jgi:hypothetical protein